MKNKLIGLIYDFQQLSIFFFLPLGFFSSVYKMRLSAIQLPGRTFALEIDKNSVQAAQTFQRAASLSIPAVFN